MRSNISSTSLRTAQELARKNFRGDEVAAVDEKEARKHEPQKAETPQSDLPRSYAELEKLQAGPQFNAFLELMLKQPPKGLARARRLPKRCCSVLTDGERAQLVALWNAKKKCDQEAARYSPRNARLDLAALQEKFFETGDQKKKTPPSMEDLQRDYLYQRRGIYSAFGLNHGAELVAVWRTVITKAMGVLDELVREDTLRDQLAAEELELPLPAPLDWVTRCLLLSRTLLRNALDEIAAAEINLESMRARNSHWGPLPWPHYVADLLDIEELHTSDDA
jgi:hypothetical protein